MVRRIAIAAVLAFASTAFMSEDDAVKQLTGEWKAVNGPLAFSLHDGRAIYIDAGQRTEGAFTIERIVAATIQARIGDKLFYIQQREKPGTIQISAEGKAYGFVFVKLAAGSPRPPSPQRRP